MEISVPVPWIFPTAVGSKRTYNTSDTTAMKIPRTEPIPDNVILIQAKAHVS